MAGCPRPGYWESITHYWAGIMGDHNVALWTAPKCCGRPLQAVLGTQLREFGRPSRIRVGDHRWPRCCVGWSRHTPWRATQDGLGRPRGFWAPTLCCGRSGVVSWSPSVLCEPPRVCVGGHVLCVGALWALTQYV